MSSQPPRSDGLVSIRQMVLSFEQGRFQVIAHSSQRVELSSEQLLVLLCFSTPHIPADLARRLAAASHDPLLVPAARDAQSWLAVIEGLAQARLLVPADAQPGPSVWEPHEWFFHLRTREEFAPWLKKTGDLTVEERCPPAIVEGIAGTWLELATPAADEPERSFLEVLSRRRSCHAFQAGSLDFEVFSALFYHAARNLEFQPEPAQSKRAWAGGLVRRPYPSGGSRYSVELYPVVRKDAIAGVEAGVYRYCPQRHALERLSAGELSATPFLQAAQVGASLDQVPPVVVVFTSRIGRTNYKYSRIGYSLILKEVGCALQTFHMVAAYLDLGVCALGLGLPTARLSSIAGFDPVEQPIVGEMVIGIPRRD